MTKELSKQKRSKNSSEITATTMRDKLANHINITKFIFRRFQKAKANQTYRKSAHDKRLAFSRFLTNHSYNRREKLFKYCTSLHLTLL